jgi:hypothetical protein
MKNVDTSLNSFYSLQLMGLTQWEIITVSYIWFVVLILYAWANMWVLYISYAKIEYWRKNSEENCKRYLQNMGKKPIQNQCTSIQAKYAQMLNNHLRCIYTALTFL